MKERLVAALVGIGIGVLTVAGCDSQSVDDPSAALTPAKPNDAVRGAALLRVDLSSDFGDDEAPDGDKVAGQVTLATCGYAYRSEAMRVARHQVAFKIDDDRSVSNEVVAYTSGGATQAMKELRAAIESCPDGVFDSSLAVMPQTKERVTKIPMEPDGVDEILAFRDVVIPVDGPRYAATLVFQRSGDMLSGLYLQGTGDLADRLIPLLGKRLTQHPATTGASA